MKYVSVDFSRITGKIKPMHAVNNGPIFGLGGIGNADAFTEAGIPCCRNHDASFTLAYGGNHAHDVLNIFTDFDADENDPANYDFTLTDKTVREIYACGSTMLYRLGSRIEHQIKKYQTYPPKDYDKYARICEHIIRHYCYGWADGMEMPIRYWEIWNEADLYNADGSNPCWQGTHEEFLKFYEIMAKHLKNCFPELKIGGPAYTGSHQRRNYMEQFVEYASTHNIPLDFFSWHGYGTNPHDYLERAQFAKDLLLKHGYTDTETILDEWNYVRGWGGEDKLYSLRSISNEKGMAYAAASMLTAQKSPLDMFMYYDARPSTPWNGLFHIGTYEIKPPYYAFWQFNKLYQLENEVMTSTDSDTVYAGAATKNGKSVAQIVYYSEDDLEPETVAVTLKGVSGAFKVTVLLTDQAHMNEKVRECICVGLETTLYFNLKIHSSMLISIEPVDL